MPPKEGEVVALAPFLLGGLLMWKSEESLPLPPSGEKGEWEQGKVWIIGLVYWNMSCVNIHCINGSSCFVSCQCHLCNSQMIPSMLITDKKIKSSCNSHNLKDSSLVLYVTNFFLHPTHAQSPQSTVIWVQMQYWYMRSSKGIMTIIEIIGFRYQLRICFHARGSRPVCGSLWKVESGKISDIDQFSFALKIPQSLYSKCFPLEEKCFALRILRKNSDCQ